MVKNPRLEKVISWSLPLISTIGQIAIRVSVHMYKSRAWPPHCNQSSVNVLGIVVINPGRDNAIELFNVKNVVKNVLNNSVGSVST